MVTAEPPQLRIAMVGYAFMGAAHSQAWRTVNRVFDLPLRATMVAVAGRTPDAVHAAADRLGWAEAVTDWRELLDRDDIDLIDVCTPGDSHAEIAIAALAPASTCCARNRWPTPSPRRRPWWPRRKRPERTGSGRCAATTTGGYRR